MSAAVCITSGEEQTVALGHQLGALSAGGDVFLLCGELGAGKTCLIRGIATGLGVAEYAFSPSFVLVREYRGRLTLYHMDFYRLEQLQEVAELGIEEYLFGDGVCAIEWAERATGLLPEEHLRIELAYVPDAMEQRGIRLSAAGARYETLLEQLVEAAAGVLTWN